MPDNGFFKIDDQGTTNRIFGTLSGQLDGPFIVSSLRVENGMENFLDFTGEAGVIWEGGAFSAQSSPGSFLVNMGLITITNDGNAIHQIASEIIFKNEGEIVINENIPTLIINQATLDNTNIGVITVVDDLSISGNFINTGLIQKLNGTGNTSIGNLINEGTGVVQIDTGTIVCQNSYTGNGLITGNGRFAAPAFEDITGTIAPGTSGPGTLEYGNSTAFESAATTLYQIEINGATQDTEYDLFEIDADAKLEGIIEVQLNYAPQLNDEFVIITADNITVCNLPAQVTTMYTNDTYTYDVICNTNNVILKVVDVVLGAQDNTLTESTIYPNPTFGNINIDLNREYQNISVQIVNMIGQVIATQTFASTTVIEQQINAPSGIYFVKVATESGASKTFKVLIK